jgi:hypothetical protein
MSVVSAELLEKLCTKPDNIRNFCIVAHVDHGKFCVEDYLFSFFVCIDVAILNYKFFNCLICKDLLIEKYNSFKIVSL